MVRVKRMIARICYSYENLIEVGLFIVLLLSIDWILLEFRREIHNGRML